jgi:uncharacterized protein YdaU (DUF1376 family)
VTDYPWFKFDVAQERALMDTMTDEQYGAHMRLRLHAWTMHGLPTHEPELRAIGRWPVGQWNRIWPTVSKQWRAEADRLVNDAQECSRLDAEGRRDKGRNASAKRWQSTSNAQALPTQCHRQDRTVQDKTDSSLTLAVGARVTPPPVDLSPGQLMASVSGLVGAWNNRCAVDGSPFTAVTVRSHPKATQALRAHPDIDWWAELFGRVGASDFLRRDAKVAPVDFWWVLDHAEEIAAGRYDNRAPQAIVDPNAASVAAAKLAVRRLMP